MGDDLIKEPIAYQCNYCEKWSEYKLVYIGKLPRGWRMTDKGYSCNDCTKKRRRKPQ
jgi:hypothetical protein